MRASFSGSDALARCRGGIGRAGTIAARLLVELGVEPATAIAIVRAVRPGAIETSETSEAVTRKHFSLFFGGL